jgi:glycosyltransferase involved in cell wall biosynthesis
VRAARVKTIHNAIETSRFASGDPSGPGALLGIEEGAPVVLFSSRLDPIKHPADAVQIFARGAAEFPDAQLVFVGTGSEEDSVRAEAQRLGVAARTHLVGYQTNIPDWLALATVWLLPTERENFSVAVLEALAAGRPILSTNCPGNDEVLVDGENSITFPVGDIERAAAGLKRLLGNVELRDSLAVQARLTAAEYTAEVMVERVHELYRTLRGNTTSLV